MPPTANVYLTGFSVAGASWLLQLTSVLEHHSQADQRLLCSPAT